MRGWIPYFQTIIIIYYFTRVWVFFKEFNKSLITFLRLTFQSTKKNPNFEKFLKTASPFHVRSPLLTKSRLIFFPLGTEMFHFPKFFCNFNKKFTISCSEDTIFIIIIKHLIKIIFAMKLASFRKFQDSLKCSFFLKN